MGYQRIWALPNLAPLFITRYKSTIIFYISINIAVLIAYLWEVEYRINHRNGNIKWVYEKGRGGIARK